MVEFIDAPVYTVAMRRLLRRIALIDTALPRLYRFAGLSALVASLAACAGAPPPPPATPEPSPATGPATGSEPIELPPAPQAVPPPPSDCAPLVQHTGAPSACGKSREATLQALAVALGNQDPIGRDAYLAALETCEAFPAGLLRALRADLAPVKCGDALIAPLLEQSPGDLREPIRDALFGLVFAARLSRLVADPPPISPPFNKQRFNEFLKQSLSKWVATQAQAIHQIAEAGAKLSGYGKGITAVEAGLADMRFVEVVRDVPLPDELASDKELRDVYYMALDEALDPRKDRGRDAALVGLRVFAELGVLHDPRVDRARALLSKLYSGRRIDALDGLLLPGLPRAELSTIELRLAARLPTFYAGTILGEADPTDPTMMRALLEHGLPAELRSKIDPTALPLNTRQLYARALVGIAQRYWRSPDFATAAKLSELATGGSGKEADEARLVLALATALKGGPKDAAEMMIRGPFLPAGVGEVSKLDALAGTTKPWAGMAAYNAAFILQLVPPTQPDPAFWNDLAARYEKAAEKLEHPDRKKAAQERAQAARDTATTLQEGNTNAKP